MRIRRYIHFLAFACLLLCASCAKDSTGEWRQPGEEDVELCEIGIGTKGGLLEDPAPGDYTSTTYRAQLFYRGFNISQYERLDSLMTPYAGTYCDPKGTNTWLTPCAVDGDFAYDSAASPAEDSQYGLRAGRYHDYYLFLNSPATEYVKYGEMEKTFPSKPGYSYTMEYWGLPYLREGDAKSHPAVSSVAEITTRGLLVQDTYLYSVPEDMVLKEYRSRMAFSVRCGDAISHANLKKLEIKGLRSNAVFRPFTKDFFFVEDSSNYEDELLYESPSATGLRLDRGGSDPDFTPGTSWSITGPDTVAELADRQTNTYFSYILSDDYKTLDASNQYIHKPAELHITLCSDDGNPITLDPIPWAFVFEPQKSYFYLITINSVYLSIDVYARDWNTPTICDATIDDPVYWSLTIGIKDWTVVENSAEVNPGQGDDAEKYDKSTEGITTDDWNAPTGGSSTID